MRTVLASCLAMSAAISASAQPLFNVDTEAVDLRAKTEVCSRYPGIQATNLNLKSMSWSREFPDERRRYRDRAVDIRYELEGGTWTNVVGTEKLEKKTEVIVHMDEFGTIPQGLPGVQTTTVTRSISTGPSRPVEGRMIHLNFRNAPLPQVTEFYSHLKGVPVITDKAIQREITCFSPIRLSEEEACRFMEAVLAEQDIQFVRQDDGSLRVVEKKSTPP
jgi:hypothetical protein